MAHDHGQAPANYNKAFALGIGLNVAYIIVEVIAGLAIHSLALLADAGHNTSDVLSLMLALGRLVFMSDCADETSYLRLARQLHSRFAR
jgi:cobalt-zinc-cadmium efflux system protein